MNLKIETELSQIFVNFFCKFSSRYHYKVFRNWQEKNQIVTLRLEKTKIILPSDMANLKSGQKRQFRMVNNETTIDPDSMLESDKMVNIELIENPNFDMVTSIANNKSVHRKESNSEYKVESCVIQV